MRAFVAFLLFILGVVAVGAIGYQLGLSQAVSVVAPGAGGAPIVAPYYWHPFGFGFGFFGLLFPILGLFLLFGLFRALAWGRGWGGHRGYGYGPWREGGPKAMLEEWHREAHGEKPASGERPQSGEGETGPRR